MNGRRLNWSNAKLGGGAASTAPEVAEFNAKALKRSQKGIRFYTGDLQTVFKELKLAQRTKAQPAPKKKISKPTKNKASRSARTHAERLARWKAAKLARRRDAS
jgi:hypothetical protein